MKISAEISLYPLHEDYESEVSSFIHILRAQDGLDVAVNGMSTQVCGSAEQVHKGIQLAMNSIFDSEKAFSCVVKYLNKPITPGETIDI